MRVGKSTKTHGMSDHELYAKLTQFRRRHNCDVGWAEFAELNPIPKEYLAGLNDCRVGLRDPAKPATLDNVGWILVEKRRE